MKKQFLEAGQIVNTHGVRGDVKIQPWANTPEFLCGLKKIYIDETKIKVKRAWTVKNMVVMSLEGINTVEQAISLKNKVIYLDRKDVKLEDGEHFVQDLIGLKVIDADTEKELGTLNDIISLPARDVYEVKGEREILIPAVPEFIIETNPDEGYIKVRLIEGM